MVTTLCRDCGALAASVARGERCGDCGSPRQVCHPAFDTLLIAHVDCDAFYATVEKRDRPDLSDLPLIIGGGARGLVLACCLRGAPLWCALGDADVQGAGRLPGCGCDPTGHGEISGGRTRGARRDAAAHAARRTIVDRRGVPRPLPHRRAPRRVPRPTPRGTRPSGRSRARNHGVDRIERQPVLARLASDLDKPVSLLWGVGPAMQRRLAGDGVTRFRLTGVGADTLVEGPTADPPSLFDREFDRPHLLEQPIDQLRERLGDGSVQRGRALPFAPLGLPPTSGGRKGRA